MSESNDLLHIPGLEALGASAELERDGAWMDVPNAPLDEAGNATIRVRLRSAHSQRVREVSMRINRRHIPKFKKGVVITPAEQDEDKVELLAQAVVSELQGFKRADGTTISTSAETVRAIMRTYPWLRDACIMFSDDRDNYLPAAQTEALEGNFGK